VATALCPAPSKPRTRPQIADILRDHGIGACHTRQQRRAVADILSCRTGALGGHVERCPCCSYSRTVFRSCCNRHCPTCQVLKQARWADAQEARLLPVVHFQVVFTVADRPLEPFFRKAPRRCLTLLFRAVAETLSEVAASNLGIDLGFTAVLHTWTQALTHYHPHVHCIVPAGGLSLDGERWIGTPPHFFLRVEALSDVFRGKLLSWLEQALREREIPIDLREGLHLLRLAAGRRWKVYVKAPLAGPQHVVRYLSRYVHRIAISNSRIVSYDGKTVVFRYKDRKAGKVKVRSLSGADFARAFLEHVLPEAFVRIRHFGLHASRRRKDLARCRELIGAPPVPKPEIETWVDAFRRLLGSDPLLCPKCGKADMVVVQILEPISP
jgi:hypothetical protein